jgi:hypothetical protein
MARAAGSLAPHIGPAGLAILSASLSRAGWLYRRRDTGPARAREPAPPSRAVTSANAETNRLVGLLGRKSNTCSTRRQMSKIGGLYRSLYRGRFSGFHSAPAN